MEQEHDGISRRAVLAGLGAVGGGAALAAGMASPAGADPGPGAADGATRAAPGGLTTISSSLIEGVSYRYLSWVDFSPESGDRLWSGLGVYSSTGATMWASVDLPPGAVLRDIEWYTANEAARSGYGRIWHSASASLTITALDVPIAIGTSIHATRLTAPNTSNGPYPNGTKLALGMSSDPANVVNGVRVGFSPGVLQTVMLPVPERVYDSRETGGSIVPNETRAISLNSAIPAGSVGALVNLSLTNTNGAGTLRVGKSTEVPVATAVQWSRTGDKVTTSTTTKVSAGRQIAVKSVASSGPTDLIVDVVGYLV